MRKKFKIGAIPTTYKKCPFCHSMLEIEINLIHTHFIEFHLDELDMTEQQKHDFIHGISIAKGEVPQ